MESMLSKFLDAKNAGTTANTVDKRIKIQKEEERLEQWGKSSKQNLE